MGDDRDLYPGTPRWVKAFGVIAVLALAFFVVLHLTGTLGAHGAGH